MLYTRIRFGLIFLFFGLGLLIHVQTGLGNAWYLYLAALLLLVTHFLFGNVWLAFSLLKKGKPEEAEQLLQQIKRPNWLVKRNRAYYHFTKGMIHLQNKELEVGKKHLLQAVATGLQRENDKALINLNLAHIYFVEKDYINSGKYLDQARACNANDLLIKENIKQLEEALEKIL